MDIVPGYSSGDLHIWMNMTCGPEYQVWVTRFKFSQAEIPVAELKWFLEGECIDTSKL